METQTLNKLPNTVSPLELVSIIIPLYGYFKDNEENQLNANVLQTFLKNVNSSKYKNYIIFVAEGNRLDEVTKKLVHAKALGGNVKGVAVDQNAPYAEYINEGINFALEETESNFIVVINPWIAIKEGAIDLMVERINMVNPAIEADTLHIISGYKVNDRVKPEGFVDYAFNPALDEVGFSYDFWGTNRQLAAMLKINEGYITRYFFQADFWGNSHGKGFTVIKSQHLPFYEFEVDWKLIETFNDYSIDAKTFETNWRFIPADVDYYEQKQKE